MSQNSRNGRQEQNSLFATGPAGGPSSEERNRARWLAAELERHNYLYHTQDAPEISDDQFDALFHELAALEDRWPELRSAHSPTLRVGGKLLDGLAKKAHSRQMYGLDNVFSVEEWRDFVERMRRAWDTELNGPLPQAFWCDPKLDGLALEIIYANGVLQEALTRGDGEVGEVVTEAVRTIRTVPLRLRGEGPFPERLEVRGEVVMYKKDFDALNERQESLGQKTFANPRNAAAGTLRQLDISVTESRPLRFLAYSLGDAQWAPAQPFPLPNMYGKNLIFKTGGVDAVHCDRLMKLIACGKLNTDFLITHRAPLNDLMEGYHVFGGKQEHCLKWAVTPPVNK